MLSLTSRAAISRALADFHLDADLRALVGLRAWQFYVEQPQNQDGEIQLFAIQGGDTPEAINAALGFAITGDQAEDPSFDHIEHHGLWYEVVYAAHRPVPTRIFVENNPGTEMGVHYLCLTYFWDQDEGREG